MLQPCADRNRESSLAPMQDVRRQSPLHQPLENVFAAHSAEFVFIRQTLDEFDDFGIQKRRAHLKPVRHAHTIDFGEHLIHAVRAQIRPQHVALKFAPIRALSKELIEMLVRRVRCTFPYCFFEERVCFLVTESAEPMLMPIPRWRMHSFEEFFEAEIEAEVPMSHGQRANERLKDVCAYYVWHSPIQLKYFFCLERGIAGKELIGAVSPERDGHVLPSKRREEVGGKRGSVGDGLVEIGIHFGNEIEAPPRGKELHRVLHAKAPRDGVRMHRFVEFLICESDRESFDWRLRDILRVPCDS